MSQLPTTDIARDHDGVPRLALTPIVWGVLLIASAAVWGGYVYARRDGVAADTQFQTEAYRPLVHVAIVERSRVPVSLTLPGDTAAIEQARIFGRATGYILRRQVDIGSRVHAGELLAMISVPELDQQVKQAEATLVQRQAALLQAKAQVNQAQSKKDLAALTNSRTAHLAGQGWASQQNADQTRLNLSSQEADVASAQASVEVAQAMYQTQLAIVGQLKELAAYERVTAPFDGVVTARNVDAGDLINPSNNSTPMFELQRDNVIRVQTYVPQAYAVGLHKGLKVNVSLPERPNTIFAGVITRAAEAQSPISRTMLMEVDIKNDDQMLSAGQFVNVTIFVPPVEPVIVVPAGAILFNGKGLRVATIDNSNTVHMQVVEISRDLGTSVEIRTGLAGGERLAVNPPISLEDGAKVRINQQHGDNVGRS